MARHLKGRAGIALDVVDESLQRVGSVAGQDSAIKGKVQHGAVKNNRQRASTVIDCHTRLSVGAIIPVIRHAIAVPIGFDHCRCCAVHYRFSRRCRQFLTTDKVSDAGPCAGCQYHGTRAARGQTHTQTGCPHAQGTQVVIIRRLTGASTEERRKNKR